MRACPNCGKDNPEEARFCMACATTLPSETPLHEVRKTVTVLFADVTGSTALGERLDPESLRRVMGRYFQEMGTAVERHGGTVEKFIGDAVMAVFGVPTVHEDDALRAVRAAAEMRETLAKLNDELDRAWGVTLAARIGVNTGEVVAGDPRTGQNLVTGDAVNVAARLEQAAAPGEILLGDLTYRLVRDAVRVDAPEALELRGKIGAGPDPSPPRGPPGHAGRRAPFRLADGRPGTTARDAAQAFGAAASDQACHLFTVLGGAGVGKSRLIQEFITRLPAGARVLRGRCLSYGEGVTFWPVVEVIRGAAGVIEDDPPAVRRRKVMDLLDPAQEVEAIADRLGELLGVGSRPPPPRRRSGRYEGCSNPWAVAPHWWWCSTTSTGRSRPFWTWWSTWPTGRRRPRSCWCALLAPTSWTGGRGGEVGSSTRPPSCWSRWGARTAPG